MTRFTILAILLVATLASALQIVLSRHQSRELFIESQGLQSQAVELDREWGRLLLEQGTLVNHNRIERIATSKLSMTPPSRDKVLIVGGSDG